MGQFYYAGKAFDILERIDPSAEYWEGKRGSAAGVLQLVLAGREEKERLRDVLQMLKNSSPANGKQVESITRVVKKWCRDNDVPVI